MVPSIGDEILPLAIGDAAVRDAMRMEQRLVARALAIERKTIRGSYVDQPFAPFDPAQ